MKKETIIKIIVLVTIPILSLVMHSRVFNVDLTSVHVWRQTQTQSTIVSFYEEDFNILNPRRNDRGAGDGIFRMEFPVMQWSFAAFYKMFGNHFVISRILTFVIGLFSLLGMYKLLVLLFKNTYIGLLGAWTLSLSPMFFYYTVNPLPDNFSLCCAIFGLVFLFSFHRQNKLFYIVLSGIFLSLSALAKLPFVIYYAAPFMYFVLNRKKFSTKTLTTVVIIFLLSFIPQLSWYLWVIPGWTGNGITQGMFDNSTSIFTLLDYLKHHLISTLPELILNYASVLFFLSGFYFIIKKKEFMKQNFYVFIALAFVVVLYFLFELNMIAKVHDYYLFPFIPLVFIIVSYGAYNLIKLNKFWLYLSFVLLLALPVTTQLRMEIRWNTEKPGFNKDIYAYKDELRQIVPKDKLCIVGNDISHYIFMYYIDKKGWGFDNDMLTPKKVKQMIDQGAEYFYSDSRIIDNNPKISKFFDKELFNKGSIRVYSLKKD